MGESLAMGRTIREETAVKHEEPYDKSVYRAWILVTQIGISLLVPICLMTLLGWYLDQKLDTVFITVILFFVGAIAGGQNAYKLVMQSLKDEESSMADADTTGRDKLQTSKPKQASGWVQSESRTIEGAEYPDEFVE